MVDFWTLGCLALFVVFVAAVVAACYLPSRLPPTGHHRGRIGFIDGLRGFLALSVVVHHFSLTIQSRNANPSEHIPRLLWNVGSTAVVIFFMITAVLFYGKLIKDDGRLDVASFACGRVFRLYPVYLLALTATMAIAPILADTRYHIPTTGSLPSFLNWALFSVPAGYTLLIGLDARPLLGMIWSLRYEWVFYIFLPLLALAVKAGARKPKARMIVLLAALGLSSQFQHLQINGISLAIASGFLWGMLIVELRSYTIIRDVMHNRAIGCLCGVLFFTFLVLGHDLYSLKQYAVCFLFLFCISVSNPAYRALDLRPCISLGDSSYSIYLLHLLIIHAFFYIVDIAGINISGYLLWISLIIVSTLIVAVSSLSYYLIEYPAILLGRRTAARFKPVTELEQAAP